MFNYVDILGIDEEEKTVLASYRNGSFSLDAIPAAVCYMKDKQGYVMLLKDCVGLVVQVDPTSTIDSVEKDWLSLKNINMEAMRQSVPDEMSAQNDPTQVIFSL